MNINYDNVYYSSNYSLRGKGLNPFKIRNKVFDQNMNQMRDPLTSKGSIERIALLPLNYTRFNAIIVYKLDFCPTRESEIGS